MYVDDNHFPTLEYDKTGDRAFKQKLITLVRIIRREREKKR